MIRLRSKKTTGVVKNPGIIGAILLAVVFSSCATSGPTVKYTVIDCPKSIREKAVVFAETYLDRETVYALGGRDYLEKEGVLEVDCSGFIVRVFQYAVKDTKYSLLFNDANVSALFANFTTPVKEPTPGDFIFMGDPKAPFPTHMSIYLRMDEEDIYFMDATEKDAEGEYPAVSGVSVRHYPKDDIRFLSYARLLVKY